jgi:hypothetical protein
MVDRMRRSGMSMWTGLAGAVTAVVLGSTAAVAPSVGATLHERPLRYDCMRDDGTIDVVSRAVDPESPAGDFSFYADITNTTSTWRTGVRGMVCFYDAAGRLVNVDWIPLDMTRLGPNARAPFVLMSDQRARTFASYKVRFTSKRLGPRQDKPVRSRVKVKVGRVGVDDFGGLVVPVTVTNRNRFPIKHVTVHTTLFDARGRIISADAASYNYTDPSRLRRGRSGTYEAHAFHDHTGVHRVRVQVEAFRNRS